jgi:carboxymethylenebutenolidase
MALSAVLAVTERDVQIKTPDGTCDAAFIYPTTGSYPGVLIWTDAFGLRPSMREMGRQLAAEGYSVLVPNPFYRVAKSPVFEDASKLVFQEIRPKIMPLMGSVTASGAAEKDAVAYIGFMDAQPEVDKAKKVGTQGYCMGGALVVRTIGGGPRARGCRGVVPWRRACDGCAEQPTSACAED